ncbi:MAG TPA: CocE/NonD family hydrolase [Blastocatellia bacterium]|nr:CocE/NonD family hydrolase [Blastocatellia bacterium]
MQKLLLLTVLYFAFGAHSSIQELDLPQAAIKDEAALAEAMPGFARRVIAIYEEPDRSRRLNALFRLQMVADQHADAVASLRSLIELRRATSLSSALPLLPFEVVAKARAKQATSGLSFDEAFKQEFRELFNHLDDKSASEALDWWGSDQNRARNDLRAAVEKQKGKDRIALADALDLIRQYHFYQYIQATMSLTNALIAEDDARRYITDKEILIKTPDGASIAAMVARPKSARTPLPALLIFTIYADDERYFSQARASAARGYAGVVAYTRGKGRSPDTPVPYEHDGEDARTAIDWISKQPWSDGRVGMYSGSYNGFTQWAATKSLHPALKTIVPYVANNPGNGLPMENNVFLFVNYAWAFYATNNKYLDNETYFDRKRWGDLNNKWYAGGKSYRQIDSVDGAPNKWLQRWLQHPGYDSYWQKMAPYKGEFAKINIPVLTITGYYDDAQQSALHYLNEHYKYNKNAEHFLLIGPYDHFGAQSSRKEAVLRGYNIDPVAQIDTPEITYQWMDYAMRGGKKPELLKDKINYQVMGANEWKHAPSLEKMSNETLTLYLTDAKAGDHYRLSSDKPSTPGFLSQEVDFADRKTTNNDSYPNPIVGKKPDLSNGFSFITEPFDEPVEISGAFLGEIKATINKKDMDIGVVLYEVMPNGELLHLSYFIGRASYAKDMSVRKLLTPGKMESIPFDRTRMVSRRLSKGSRLLVTLNVNKNPYAQINYGTGKDVSDEDINDAKPPLQIKWHNDSYVKIPVWK